MRWTRCARRTVSTSCNLCILSCPASSGCLIWPTKTSWPWLSKACSWACTRRPLHRKIHQALHPPLQLTRPMRPEQEFTMTTLNQAHCEACRADAPQVSDAELPALIKQIPDWNIEVRDSVMQLEKVFLFKNFKFALAFTNAVGEIAE